MNIKKLLWQLPVVASLIPSLVANEIGLVQALDRRVGSIFYMNLTYGTTKGADASGNTFVSALTGHDSSVAGRLYGSQIVTGENVGAQGNTTFTGTVANTPILTGAGNTVVTAGAVVLTDNGAGVLVGNVSGASGTITSGGVYAVTLPGAASAQPTISYVLDYQHNASGVPEVNFNITSSSLTALDFPLRARYTMAAAIDLKKAHGLDLEDMGVKMLGQEVKFEIDHYGIDLINGAAASAAGAGTAPTFSTTVGNGQEFVWRKYELINNIEKGSNLIFSKTLRAMATFIVCGNNVAALISQLAPNFVRDGSFGKKAPTGPMVIGKLDGRTVIQDPFMPVNNYTLGYKGDNILQTGFIYAPYIPLFTTPTLVTSDLQAQKGFLSSSGFKVINPGMFSQGQIS